MSHTPPIPEAAIAPYPATPAPHAPSDAPATADRQSARGSGVDKRLIAGIAVGSAAIAAALLFAGRTTRPKSAATARPATGAPQAHRPDATD